VIEDFAWHSLTTDVVFEKLGSSEKGLKPKSDFSVHLGITVVRLLKENV